MSQVDKYNEKWGKGKPQDTESKNVEAKKAQESRANFYAQVKDYVIDGQNASLSELRTKFKIGAQKAEALLSQMEQEGIISSPDENNLGIRSVLVKKEDAMSEEDKVEENKTDDATKPIDNNAAEVSEIGNDEFWHSELGKKFNRKEYLTNPEIYAEVKAAYEQFIEDQKTPSEEGQEVPAEEVDSKPTLVVGEDDGKNQSAENEDAEWVKEYDAYLIQWGKDHNNDWERDLGDDESKPEGLKGSFKTGATYHYASPEKVSVKIAKDQEAKAEDFYPMLDLANEKEQSLTLTGNMTQSFERAILEAAAKKNVLVENMDERQEKIYASYQSKDEGKTDANQSKNADEGKDNAENPISRVRRMIAQGHKDATPEEQKILEEHNQKTAARAKMVEELKALEAKGASIGGDGDDSKAYTEMTIKSLESRTDTPSKGLKDRTDWLKDIATKYGENPDSKKVEAAMDKETAYKKSSAEAAAALKSSEKSK